MRSSYYASEKMERFLDKCLLLSVFSCYAVSSTLMNERNWTGVDCGETSIRAAWCSSVGRTPNAALLPRPVLPSSGGRSELR